MSGVARRPLDDRPGPGHLAAAETVPHALEVLFVLHRRVRPYNKYLRWELERRPLGDPARARTVSCRSCDASWATATRPPSARSSLDPGRPGMPRVRNSASSMTTRSRWAERNRSSPASSEACPSRRITCRS
ncbi:hypothetical protein BJ965_001552 [Streptomyces luteogriseus]|uniref:Uncharacterized protein n=1 Tax=Streptomyces luteogriseus TaxID=68233 RepID=A0A7W7DJF4_9ACTN|nr:hypothetical protein [Streptomyces luteogriseus]MBB4711670.1 hypothetical protein [Streptomyces luteogriseus]